MPHKSSSSGSGRDRKRGGSRTQDRENLRIGESERGILRLKEEKGKGRQQFQGIPVEGEEHRRATDRAAETETSGVEEERREGNRFSIFPRNREKKKKFRSHQWTIQARVQLGRGPEMFLNLGKEVGL